MNSFALYRLPHQSVCTLVEQTEGLPLEWHSCEELTGHTGFVVAPFADSPQYPGLLIRADLVSVNSIVTNCFQCRNKLFPVQKQVVSSAETNVKKCDDSPKRPDYTEDFSVFHDRLEAGDFRKLVLSRCEWVEKGADDDPLLLFQRACELYPRLFISLVYTPKSGLWLTATPEILLEGEGQQWHTIALAGTMKLEGDQLAGEGERMCWSAKNIEEQRYVATYIHDCLKTFSDDIREEGPRTVRAANLVHLRSDFTFTLLNNTRVGQLLQALHPTPAVCGLPKEEAFRFILEHEHSPRLYYSGFMGPLGLLGQTHLYVSLRCMQIDDQYYRLYAGGGLLRESTESQEWQETEAKLETMKRCIATKKTSIS